MNILTKEQEANIVSFLTSNYSLPKYGFVAGQAVASLIYKELNLNIEAPINDVDVFQVQLKEFESETYATCSQHHDNLSINSTGGGSNLGSYYVSPKRGYRVTKSIYMGEDNNINLVLIKQYPNRKELDQMMLLTSFDFNCCAVGFDIKTKTFYMTDSFVAFIKTKQLRVQSVHTPFHSVLRLNKKIKDLGENIYCDLNLERTLLLNSTYIFLKNEVVGERFFNLYEKQKDDFIEKMFEIKEHVLPEIKSTDEEIIKKNQELINAQKDKYKVVTLSKGFHNNYIERETAIKTGFSSIFKNKGTQMNYNNLYGYSENLEDQLHLNYKSYVSLFHLIYETKLFSSNFTKRVIDFFSTEKSFEEKYLGNAILLQKLSSNPLTKIKFEDDSKLIQRFVTIVKRHQSLWDVVEKHYKNEELKDLLIAIKKIASKEKKDKRYQFFYGLIETGYCSPILIADNLNLDFEVLKDKVLKSVKIKKTKKTLLKNKNMNIFNFVQIKEMTKFQDFFEAGTQMNNCIGGHFINYVLREDTRYFDIMFFGKRTNLFFNSFKIIEHKSKNNKEPSISESLFAKLFTLFMIDKPFFFLKEYYLVFKMRNSLKNKLTYYKQKKLMDLSSNWNLIKKKISEKTFLKLEYKENPDLIPMDFDDDLPF